MCSLELLAPAIARLGGARASSCLGDSVTSVFCLCGFCDSPRSWNFSTLNPELSAANSAHSSYFRTLPRSFPISETSPLCFHNLTNPFSRNFLPLIIIQIGRGVPPSPANDLNQYLNHSHLTPMIPITQPASECPRPERPSLPPPRCSACSQPRQGNSESSAAGLGRLQTQRRWPIPKANGRIIPPQPCRKVAKDRFCATATPGRAMDRSGCAECRRRNVSPRQEQYWDCGSRL
jgi:hypothetical protein